jgi:hypothetical protein
VVVCFNDDGCLSCVGSGDALLSFGEKVHAMRGLFILIFFFLFFLYVFLSLTLSFFLIVHVVFSHRIFFVCLHTCTLCVYLHTPSSNLPTAFAQVLRAFIPLDTRSSIVHI